VSLVFQAVLPALLFAAKPTRLVLKGGTHVPWSPPTTYVEQVFLPALAKMNIRASMKTIKWGYYPQGSGIAEAEIEPCQTITPIELTERGGLVRIAGAAVVSNLPESIAERECRRFLQRLSKKELAAEIEINQSPSAGRGTCLMIIAEYETAVAGFSSLGEIGKRAEVVADEAFDEFVAFHRSDAAVDKHLADQLVIYMALAGGRSTLTVSGVTDHLLTNIWVVEQFLPVKFEVVGEKESPGRVSVEGIGFKPGMEVFPKPS
jgi:RNA 3'-terminal phosphate cyclase (ATP)